MHFKIVSFSNENIISREEKFKLIKLDKDILDIELKFLTQKISNLERMNEAQLSQYISNLKNHLAYLKYMSILINARIQLIETFSNKKYFLQISEELLYSDNWYTGIVDLMKTFASGLLDKEILEINKVHGLAPSLVNTREMIGEERKKAMEDFFDKIAVSQKEFHLQINLIGLNMRSMQDIKSEVCKKINEADISNSRKVALLEQKTNFYDEKLVRIHKAFEKFAPYQKSNLKEETISSLQTEINNDIVLLELLKSRRAFVFSLGVNNQLDLILKKLDESVSIINQRIELMEALITGDNSLTYGHFQNLKHLFDEKILTEGTNGIYFSLDNVQKEIGKISKLFSEIITDLKDLGIMTAYKRLESIERTLEKSKNVKQNVSALTQTIINMKNRLVAQYKKEMILAQDNKQMQENVMNEYEPYINALNELLQYLDSAENVNKDMDEVLKRVYSYIIKEILLENKKVVQDTPNYLQHEELFDFQVLQNKEKEFRSTSIIEDNKLINNKEIIAQLLDAKMAAIFKEIQERFKLLSTLQG